MLLIIVGSVLLVGTSAAAFIATKVAKIKQGFRAEGASLPTQDAVNMLFQGGFFPDVARALAYAEKHELPVTVDKLQIHAQSAGRPLDVVKALHYVRQSSVKSVRVGFRHLCLIDLSGQALLPLIRRAEQPAAIKTEGVLGFTGHKFEYVYEAWYRRPLLSMAFDTFSEEEVRQELNRKLGDLHRYHKELLRVDAKNPDAVRRLLLQTVLRPNFWERNFNLLLAEHRLHLQPVSQH